MLVYSLAVQFRATEAAQDPRARSDEVLLGGAGGPCRSLALGPRCFLSACWKSTNNHVIGQVSREPCAVAAPTVPCGTSRKALNILLFFPVFHCLSSLCFCCSQSLVI